MAEQLVLPLKIGVGKIQLGLGAGLEEVTVERLEEPRRGAAPLIAGVRRFRRPGPPATPVELSVVRRPP